MADISMMPRGVKAKVETNQEDQRPQKAPRKDAAGKGGKSSSSRGGKKADVDELVMQMAKLTLSNARKTATLEACVLQCVLFDKEDVIATTAKQTAQDYGKMVKELEPKEREKCGGPHLYIWHECVRALATAGKKVAEDYLKETKNEAEKHVEPESLPAAMRDIYAENLKAFRVVKTWNPAVVRLEVGVEKNTKEDKVVKALISYLCEKAKGVKKTGTAPKSDAERKVQRMLEQLAN
eukprot:TRINITY_DN28218_c0_g1_i17.p2 TRINITY_DN28218_c0_g1~~TRINITY_DN28218_c0_g1_i17.p2  ORF type:complete len:237 (-),score=76.04 TRINITY_DN28218_c0_g1_i17:188-898(-)